MTGTHEALPTPETLAGVTDVKMALYLLASIFRTYEQGHRQKPDHEKADRNLAYAKFCERFALGSASPAPRSDSTEEVERLIKIGCTSADLHLMCTYPSCSCKALPAAIRAAISALPSPPGTGDGKG